MKKNYVLHLLAFALLYGCNNNDSNKGSTTDQTTTTTEVSNAGKQLSTDVQQGDGVVGKWMMYLDAFDENGNQQLDDEERNKAVSIRYDLVLNADGTCRLQNIFTATYTINTQNGNKILQVQRKRIEGEEDTDPPPDTYHIKYVNNKEMILLLVDGAAENSFWIFKRT
jgi:hypothetical protein